MALAHFTCFHVGIKAVLIEDTKHVLNSARFHQTLLIKAVWLLKDVRQQALSAVIKTNLVHIIKYKYGVYVCIRA